MVDPAAPIMCTRGKNCSTNRCINTHLGGKKDLIHHRKNIESTFIVGTKITNPLADGDWRSPALNKMFMLCMRYLVLYVDDVTPNWNIFSRIEKLLISRIHFDFHFFSFVDCVQVEMLKTDLILTRIFAYGIFIIYPFFIISCYIIKMKLTFPCREKNVLNVDQCSLP